MRLFDDINAENISSDYLRNGIRLARFYLAERERLFLMFDMPEEIRVAQELADWLRHTWPEKEKYISLPDIGKRGPYKLRTAEVARPIVEILKLHGYLLPGPPEGATINNIRRREVWLVNRKDPE